MRRPFIAGNWKMNLTHIEAMKFVEDIGYSFENKNDVEICICPPFTALRSVKTVLESDEMDVSLGAQNVYFEESGAYTGEISTDMLKAIGVEYVIVGHSERREILNETDDTINKKVKALFNAGLKPILCVGESLDIRESGKAEEFVLLQVERCLEGISEENLVKLTIAYEPIWAIGTGKTATSDDADFMCGKIREKIKKDFSEKSAQVLRIQYGGSVKPHNISELMDMPDIDGALVGGASLNVEDFIAIINY